MRKITAFLILAILLTAPALAAERATRENGGGSQTQVKTRAEAAPEASCPDYLPPGTPEWLWDSEVWQVWQLYAMSMIYHYYFGGTSVFCE